jgi:phage baseplate assembly protein W
MYRQMYPEYGSRLAKSTIFDCATSTVVPKYRWRSSRALVQYVSRVLVLCREPAYLVYHLLLLRVEY